MNELKKSRLPRRAMLLAIVLGLLVALVPAVLAQTDPGEAFGKSNHPRDIDVDSAGNFYVLENRASIIRKMDGNGALLSRIGSKGRDQGQLLRPSSLAVSGSTIWLADTGNHRIVGFTTDGAFVRQFGSRGSKAGQFSSPQGVAVDAAGNIYVADTNNHRIQVFDAGGNFIRGWGSQGSGDGQFIYPAHIEVAPGGGIFVTDSHNHRIQVFTPAGAFFRKWGTRGAGDGQFNLPVGVDVGSDGHVYIADTYNHRAQVFTVQGVFLSQWSTNGPGMTTSRPNGILYHNGKVYVADVEGTDIRVYTP
jgi:DNA-binding beta-propeller fold protein YncE